MILQSSEPAPPTPTRGGLRAKTILMIVGIGFLLLLGGGVAVYFYVFPPGVYVNDSFRRPHDDIEQAIRVSNARIEDGNLIAEPMNEKFDLFLYQKSVSDKSEIEATIQWREGDEDVLFGVVCCAKDDQNFTALMISGRSTYLLNQYAGGKWYDITGFLRLPETIKITKNVPYEVKLTLEGNVISGYLNDEFLFKIVDHVDHTGKSGIYAQGGKTGKSQITFDSFEAAKQSLFQEE